MAAIASPATPRGTRVALGRPLAGRPVDVVGRAGGSNGAASNGGGRAPDVGSRRPAPTAAREVSVPVGVVGVVLRSARPGAATRRDGRPRACTRRTADAGARRRSSARRAADVGEDCRRRPCRRAPRVVVPHDPTPRRRRLGGQPATIVIGNSSPLAAWIGHHPDGVVVVFGQDRVGDLRSRWPAVAPTPGSGGRRARRRRPRPGPGRSRSARAARRRARRARRARRRAARRSSTTPRAGRPGAPADALGERADVGERLGDRVVGQPSGGSPRSPHAPPAASTRTARRRCSRTAGAQRGDERELVGRVVGGAQRQQEMPDLGGGVDDRRVLGPVRDLRRRSRASSAGSEIRVGSRIADVAGRHGRSRSPSSTTGQPSASAVRPRGDIGGSRAPQLVGAPARRPDPSQVVVALVAEHGDRPVVEEVGAAGVERLERGCVSANSISRPNTSLAKLDHGRVDGSWRSAAVSAPIWSAAREVLRDVGAAESVDRLLRVADDEQPPGRRRGRASRPPAAGRRARREPDGDLELDRVGVLELVEQHPRVRVVEVARTSGVVASSRGRARAGRGTRGARLGAVGGGVEHEPAEIAPRTSRRWCRPARAARRRGGRRPARGSQLVQRGLAAVLLPFRLAAARTSPTPTCRSAATRLARTSSRARSRGRAASAPFADSRTSAACESSSGSRTAAIVGAASRLCEIEAQRPGRRGSTRSSTRSQLPRKSSAIRRTPVRIPNPSNSHSSTSVRPRRGCPARRRIVEQAVEQVAPTALRMQLALQLVEDARTRAAAGLDRVLEQQPAGERVQRPDRRVVERRAPRPPLAPRSLEARRARAPAARRPPSR